MQDKTLTSFVDRLEELLDLLAAASPGQASAGEGQEEKAETAQMRRARRKAEIDRLRSDLMALLLAAGLLHQSEEERLFREMQAMEPPAKDLAAEFARLEVARNPIARARRHSEARAHLNALAHSWWSRRGRPLRALSRLSWRELTLAEQKDVRKMCRHLTETFRSRGRRGARRKADIDTVMTGLAEIFIQWTDLTCHPLALPQDEKSAFIRFAAIVLADSFKDEAGAALSKRWKRLKEREARAERESSFQPDPSLIE